MDYVHENRNETELIKEIKNIIRLRHNFYVITKHIECVGRYFKNLHVYDTTIS